MRRQRTILIEETCSQPKVQEFLNSVGRNSQSSKEVYSFALSHFQTFLHNKYDANYTLETILDAISNNQMNVYSLIDNFVSYLLSNKLSPNSISLYVAAIRSYFGYHDIDIVPSKFKRKVRLPKRLREDEEPIDASDIRKILLSCNNRRLKAYLLVLASSGLRAVEALALRNCDIDFSSSPVKIHVRKEFTKTRVARDVYISDEASKFLQKEWIEWKYTNRRGKTIMTKSPSDIVFTKYRYGNRTIHPDKMYVKILDEFAKVLKTIGMDERKEGMNRRKITLHSFRRYVKTVTATQINSDYSEWLLGHAKSPYWTMKETERREIYASRLMRSLTFLDYTTLELSGQNVEARLEVKEKEIAHLREREASNADAISILRTQVNILMSSNKTMGDSGKQKLAENMIRKKIYV